MLILALSLCLEIIWLLLLPFHFSGWILLLSDRSKEENVSVNVWGYNVLSVQEYIIFLDEREWDVAAKTKCLILNQIIAGRFYSGKGSFGEIWQKIKIIGGDLKAFGRTPFCSSTGSESRDKGGRESSITRQCWSLLNVYVAIRNADSSNCLFLVLDNYFCGRSQIFLLWKFTFRSLSFWAADLVQWKIVLG